MLSETEGKGVDLIIEMVGGEIGRRNFECLATKGTMIVYGAASGEDFQVSALSLLAKMQTVKGYNLNLESAANIGGHTQALQENIAAGNLKNTVMEFPLEQAAEAHRAIENRKTTGKVVLTV
ncbi:MAG: zinc-binding dehydrogenase [Pyrinomonadaceae bacterium]